MSKKRIKIFVSVFILIIAGFISYKVISNINPNPEHEVGDKLDSLNGVYVYYNGGIGNVEERNLAPDGYNLGLKYQCVEFVKRYYYEHYHHKMPDTYGNAKDFFDEKIADACLNPKRDLIQFTNPSSVKPKVGDLLIFAGHSGNHYGHVAIISQVDKNSIELVQQNPGPFADSRVTFSLNQLGEKFAIDQDRILGRLRMKP